MVRYWLAVAVLALVLVGNAWVSDDALITLRYALNFSHGFGAVFEWGERVQGYTHPLWFLLLSIFAWVNAPLSVLAQLFLGPILVLVSAWMWGQEYRKSKWLVWIVLGLCLSNVWVDFASSGLEGGLAVFLSTCLWRARKRGAFLQLALWGSLLCLTRTDFVLLVLPLLISSYRQRGARRFGRRHTAAFFLPLLVWHVGALVYYGDPLPNTYYAKTATEIPRAELVVQGFAYLWSHLVYDAATYWLIAAGVWISLAVARYRTRGLRYGLWAYLVYLVWIGGDFMLGRFLQIPLLWSILLLLEYEEARHIDAPVRRRLVEIWGTTRGRLVLITVVLSVLWSSKAVPYVYGLFGGEALVLSNVGVSDERSYYVNEGLGLSALQVYGSKLSGIFEVSRNWTGVVESARSSRRRIMTVCGSLGWRGVLQSDIRFLDVCGLTDAFLARVPFTPELGKPWRMGHFSRKKQESCKEYVGVVKTSETRFSQVGLQELYEDVFVMSRAPIWMDGRLARVVTRFVYQFSGLDLR